MYLCIILLFLLLLLLYFTFYSNLEFCLYHNVRVCRRHVIRVIEKDINSGIRGVYIHTKRTRGKKGSFSEFQIWRLAYTLLPFDLRSDAVWITFWNIVVMETHSKIK
jgi:hypothetical protein